MDAENTNPDPNRQIAAGPGSTNPRDLLNRGSDVYNQTKQTVSQAYDRTARKLSQGYDQAISYGRDNPGTVTLVAFGAGFALGLLLSGTRRSRTSRYAEPIVNVLSDIALDFVRHR